MESLLEYGPVPFFVIGIMFSLLAGALVLIITTRAELTQMRDNYNLLLDYLGGRESRDMLRELAITLRNIEHENRMRDKDIEQLFSLMTYCVQKVAIVRYNAFHNVGSDQSFSVALLDSEDNGVVFSGIFGRDSSTTYAKPINAGMSDYVLTGEEEEAIGIARRRYIDTSYFKRGN